MGATSRERETFEVVTKRDMMPAELLSTAVASVAFRRREDTRGCRLKITFDFPSPFSAVLPATFSPTFSLKYSIYL